MMMQRFVSELYVRQPDDAHTTAINNGKGYV